MGNYTIFWMFENPRRGRQARNFTTSVPKILVLKLSSEQIFSRKLPLGAPDMLDHCIITTILITIQKQKRFKTVFNASKCTQFNIIASLKPAIMLN